MIFLGIDPGTTIIGYGIVVQSDGRLRPLDWGVLRNPGIDSSADKLATQKALADIIATWKPKAAAVEKLFFMNNHRTAMPVSEMRGVLMLTLAEHGLPVHELTPLQVKQWVCGHGRAQKPQVEKMVRAILSIKEEIRPDDAADALALAICCSMVQKSY